MSSAIKYFVYIYLCGISISIQDVVKQFGMNEDNDLKQYMGDATRRVE